MTAFGSKTGGYRDAVSWLSSKLEEPWSADGIVSFLSPELLQNVKTRFGSLETPVKLRLLCSFVLLRKRLLLEMQQEIRDILQLGRDDEDDWVRAISQLLTPIASGQPRLDVDCDNDKFRQCRDEIRQLISDYRGPPLCPMECAFVSASLFPKGLATGNPHFKLKKPLPAVLTKETFAPPKKRPAGGLGSSSADAVSRRVDEPSTAAHPPPASSLPSVPPVPPPLFKPSGQRHSSLTSFAQRYGEKKQVHRSTSGISVIDIDEVKAINEKKESDAAAKKRKRKPEAGEADAEAAKAEAKAKKLQEKEEKVRQKEQERDRLAREKVEAKEAKQRAKEEEKEKKRLEKEAAAGTPKAARPSPAKKKAKEGGEMYGELPATPVPQIPISALGLHDLSMAAQYAAPAKPMVALGAAAAGMDVSAMLQQALAGSGPQVSSTPGASPFTPALSAQAQQQQPPPPQLAAALQQRMMLSQQKLQQAQQAAAAGPRTAGEQQQPQQPPPLAPYPPSVPGTPFASMPFPPTPSSAGLFPPPATPQVGAAPAAAGGLGMQLPTPAAAAAAASAAAAAGGVPSTPSAAGLGMLASYASQQQQQQQEAALRQRMLLQQQYERISGAAAAMQPPTPLSAAAAAVAPPVPLGAQSDAAIEQILEQASSVLSPIDRATIVRFLKGVKENPNPAAGPIRQIVLSMETKQNPNGQFMIEQLVFEINYESGSWRKLRRKKPVQPEQLQQLQQMQQQQQQPAPQQPPNSFQPQLPQQQQAAAGSVPPLASLASRPPPF